METDSPEDEWIPTFYVGQHETKRSLPVTDFVLNQAHQCNYDMLTSPITTDHFHNRVLALLSKHGAENRSISELEQHGGFTSPKIPGFSPLDTPLTPSTMTSQLLAMTSPWIDLCSPDPLIYDVSKQVLCLEVAYAAFCGIEHVFVAGPRLYHANGDLHTNGLPQYARAIQETLNIGSHIQIHIMLPMIDHPDERRKEVTGDLASLARDEYLDELEEVTIRKTDIFGTWEAWNVIRTVCKYSARLFVALSIPRHLPPLTIQSRWYSEPIRLLSMTDTTFARNEGQYPVLSKVAQNFLSRLMRIKNPPWILLCDVGPIPGLKDPEEVIPVASGHLTPSVVADASASPTPAEAAEQSKTKKKGKRIDHTPHLTYIRHLQLKQPPRTAVEKYGAGYQDYLQVPLQPLTDNLESMTYEVFEKDPVKYDLYEQAIRRALRDWADLRKPTSNPQGRVVVAVCGAGRGPLVTRALRASRKEAVEIELWAVEKNPNAFVLLQRHNYSNDEWNGQVKLVESDMRSWKGPWREDASLLRTQEEPNNMDTSQDSANFYSPEESYHEAHPNPPSSPPISLPSPGHTPIDILISELLGSFGDNELSPECLDGIIHLLNPVHGISIPTSYTAYMTPIAAPKLHADISTRAAWDPTAPDTPAVVWLHAIDYLSMTYPSPPSASAAIPTTPSKPSPHNSAKNKKDNSSSTTTPVEPPIPLPIIKPVWTFTHHPPSSSPSTGPPITNTHNIRHTTLSFPISQRSILHGLAGYFTSVLYTPQTSSSSSSSSSSSFPLKAPTGRRAAFTFPTESMEESSDPILMSTNPITHSPDMISWFPMYFPLRHPVWVPDGGEVSVDVWRMEDGRKVWYEWCVEAFGIVSGRRVRVGGGEIQSSKERGCLM